VSCCLVLCIKTLRVWPLKGQATAAPFSLLSLLCALVRRLQACCAATVIMISYLHASLNVIAIAFSSPSSLPSFSSSPSSRLCRHHPRPLLVNILSSTPSCQQPHWFRFTCAFPLVRNTASSSISHLGNSSRTRHADTVLHYTVEHIFSGGRDTISIHHTSLQPDTICILMVLKHQQSPRVNHVH